MRLSYTFIQLWITISDLNDRYLWTYVWCSDFNNYFKIKKCKSFIIEVPLRQEYNILLQGATNLLFGLNKKEISDLSDFRANAKPCVVISIPDTSNNLQKTVFIVSENDYKEYNDNLFSIFEWYDIETKYKILNNIFLSFENIALIQKDNDFEKKNKDRLNNAYEFMEELTHEDDLLKDNKIIFI